MIPANIKTMLRDDARKYPYAPGRYASAARVLAEQRRTAARVAALPDELREAYDEAGGCWFDALAVHLPYGARLVCEMRPDDINPLEDCYTFDSVKYAADPTDPTDFGAESGWVQTRRNSAPRMLYHAGRYDWRWIESCHAEPLHKEAIHYRTRGASRSVALDLARESAIRGLDYARQAYDDGCQSTWFSVSIEDAEGRVIVDGDSCGGFDDEEYARDEMLAAVLDALEEFATKELDDEPRVCRSCGQALPAHA